MKCNKCGQPDEAHAESCPENTQKDLTPEQRAAGYFNVPTALYEATVREVRPPDILADPDDTNAVISCTECIRRVNARKGDDDLRPEYDLKELKRVPPAKAAESARKRREAGNS